MLEKRVHKKIDSGITDQVMMDAWTKDEIIPR